MSPAAVRSLRLLLVEGVRSGSFERAFELPELAALVRTTGAVVRWLRFGLPAAGGPSGGDLTALGAACAALVPSHAVVAGAAAADFAAALRQTRPTPRLAWLEHPAEPAPAPAEPTVVRLAAAPDGWRAFLGLGPALPTAPAPPPDFGFAPGNAAAAAEPPLPGLRLAADPAGAFDPAALRRFLAAFSATAPPFVGRPAVRLRGPVAPAALLGLATGLSAEAGPPCDWLGDLEPAACAAAPGALRQAALLLHGSGQRFCPLDLGLRTLTPGPPPSAGAAGPALTVALAFLAEVVAAAEAAPDAFALLPHSRLGLDLFGPAARAEDVTFALRLVVACGLEALLGPALAVPAAADSVSGEAQAGPRDPRAVVLRELVRLAATPAAAGTEPGPGPLAEALAQARGLGYTSAAWIAELGQLATLQAPSPADPVPAPAALLATWCGVQQPAAPSRSADAQSDWVRPPAALEAADPALRLHVALVAAGLKPVAKLEPLSPADAERVARDYALPNSLVRLSPLHRDPPVAELLWGREPADVVRAVELAAVSQSETDPVALAGILEEIGALLGYPACCASAFARQETPTTRRSYAWLALARRVAKPGPVPPALHPWAGFLANHYVPCALDCAPSLRLAAATAEVARAALGEEHVAAVAARTRHPYLALLRGQGSALELIPDETPGERFRCRAGTTHGGAPELGYLTPLDEVVIEPARLVVLRRGRPLADLSLFGFVWWHERAFQVSFWTQLLHLRRRRSASALSPAAAPAHPPRAVASPETAALGAELTAALAWARGRSAPAVRFTADLAPVAATRLGLTLRRGGLAVELLVEAAVPGARALFRVGRFAFSHPADVPLTTPGARALVRDLVAALQAWRAARAAWLPG